MPILSLTQQASSDDAVQSVATGAVVLTDTGGRISSVNHVGIRFPNATIPRGSTINSATLTFDNYLGYYGSGTVGGVTLYGQPNASSFTTTSNNIGSRSRTTASLTNIPATDGLNLNVATILQEVVDSSSWSSGSAVGLLFIGSGATEDKYTRPYFYDYLSGFYKANLSIDYTPPVYAHELSDNFNDNSRDVAKWNSYGVIAEQNKRLEFPMVTGSTWDMGYHSVNKYNFYDSSVSIEVVNRGTYDSRGPSLYFLVEQELLVNEVMFELYKDSLIAWKNIETVYSRIHTAIYNPVADRFLRIREAAGTTYWETSPNGVTWNVFASTPNVIDFSAVNLEVEGVSGPATAPSSNIILDNFNVIPYSIALTRIGTGGGSAVMANSYGEYHIVVTGTATGIGTYATVFQPLPQKDYEYRVFDPEGNYIATWKDVTSDFSYSQTINQNASELNVKIGRSPDNVAVSYDTLLDENSDPIKDENGDTILVSTETPNSVGAGTDVELNYNVDVYAFWGGYDQLLDENSDPIIDENGEVILSQYGAPNGKRVYSGYIADYELTYGQSTGVNVLVVPHATEMSHYVFMDGTSRTVSYLNTDPVVMAREAMDNYISQGGVITYNEASMPLSGESEDYDFNLQTTREAVDRATELLPLGHYHFVHPGENIQYLLEKSDTADHTFYYEKHITELVLKKSITQLINEVYFIGGDTGAGDLYTYHSDITSITNYRRGLERLSDSRVTQYSTAQAFSMREINEGKEPRYRTSVTITDVVYDIESIRLGHMIAFKNFGTFLDNLLLQVVTLNKRKHSVTLDLDMVVPSEAKRFETIKRTLLSEEIRNIDSVPS